MYFMLKSYSVHESLPGLHPDCLNALHIVPWTQMSWNAVREETDACPFIFQGCTQYT